MKKFKLFYVLLVALIVIFSTGCPQVKDILDPPPDVATGDTLWVHEIPGKDSLFMIHTLALGHDGTVYYAVGGGTVYWTAARVRALNPDNGQVIWESERMDHISLYSEIMVGDDGTVYAAGTYKLYAFDGSTGLTKWIWEVPNELPNPDNPNQNVYTKGSLAHLALTDDGNILTATCGSGVYARSIYLISSLGDMIYYNLKANGLGVETGFAIGKNNMAYYYSRDINQQNPGMRLVALDLSNGTISWTLPISTYHTSSNNIAIQEDGNLFCVFEKESGSGRKAHIINAGNGSIIWSSSFLVEPGPKLIGPDGKFYEQSGSYSYSVSSASRAPAVNLSNYTWVNVGAITQNNKLLIAFTGLDRVRQLGAFSTSGVLDFSTPMNGLDGSRMVVSPDKVVYSMINLTGGSFQPRYLSAIQGNSTIANTGWPMIRHDNQNTANINK